MTIVDQPELDVLDTPQAGARMIRGTGVRLLLLVAGTLIGALSTPIVVRHLGPVDFGDFQTIGSLIFIVTGITEGGLGNLGVREFSTLVDEHRAELMRDLLGLRLVLAGLGGALAVAFAVCAGYPTVMVDGALLGAAAMMLSIVRVTQQIPLSARLRLVPIALIDFAQQLLTALLMVALALAGAGLLPFYVVSLATAAVALAITAPLAVRHAPVTPRLRLRRWLPLLRQTAIYGAASALGVAYFQIAMLAMSLLASGDARGIYAVPFRIVSLANTVPWMLAVSAFPIVARAAGDDPQRLRYALQRMIETSLVVGCGIGIVTAAGADVAVQVIGGAKFQGSGAVLMVLAAGIPLTYLVATWSFGLLALHRVRDLIVCNAAALAAACVLSLILIPTDGALGAAIVTVALELLLSILYGVAIVRARPELRPDPRPILRLAVPAGAALIVGLVLPVSSLIAALAAGALYVGLAVAFRAIPAEFRELLRGLG